MHHTHFIGGTSLPPLVIGRHCCAVRTAQCTPHSARHALHLQADPSFESSGAHGAAVFFALLQQWQQRCGAHDVYQWNVGQPAAKVHSVPQGSQRVADAGVHVMRSTSMAWTKSGATQAQLADNLRSEHALAGPARSHAPDWLFAQSLEPFRPTLCCRHSGRWTARHLCHAAAAARTRIGPAPLDSVPPSPRLRFTQLHWSCCMTSCSRACGCWTWAAAAGAKRAIVPCARQRLSPAHDASPQLPHCTHG